MHEDKYLQPLCLQEEKLMEEYTKTQTAEREFVDTLQEKYGQGTIDIANGLFIPVDTTESTETPKENS